MFDQQKASYIPSDQWRQNVDNALQYDWDAKLFEVSGWFYTFMGDFEATYWAQLAKRDLLPPVVRYASELYINRKNTVVIGFTNTSYTPPPTNWTTFPDENDTLNETQVLGSPNPFHTLEFTADPE